MTQPDWINYRVDFIIVKDIHGRRRNHQAFTFTLAADQFEAGTRVLDGHPSETLKIIGIAPVK